MNKNPAIVVVAYNREKPLRNLLNVIGASNYANDADINLVISIDYSIGQGKITKIAEDFNWPYGPKKIISHSENLGLKEHILFCGDLSIEYGAVIVLEDDLLVSKEFYSYACESTSFYANESAIAGISLFNHCYNEDAKLPFFPGEDGTDGYFMRIASSWGQVWNDSQWKNFRKWYLTADFEELKSRIPEGVQKWPESSWKKHFILYLEETDKFFFYPNKSFTVNTSAPGVHHKVVGNHLTPNLAQESKNLRFPQFTNSRIKYDSFCEVDRTVSKYYTRKHFSNLEFNLYGFKKARAHFQICPVELVGENNIIESFGKILHPHELNILYEIEGKDYCLIENKKPLKKAPRRDFKFYYRINPNFFPIYFDSPISIKSKKLLLRLKSKMRI